MRSESWITRNWNCWITNIIREIIGIIHDLIRDYWITLYILGRTLYMILIIPIIGNGIDIFNLKQKLEKDGGI